MALGLASCSSTAPSDGSDGSTSGATASTTELGPSTGGSTLTSDPTAVASETAAGTTAEMTQTTGIQTSDTSQGSDDTGSDATTTDQPTTGQEPTTGETSDETTEDGSTSDTDEPDALEVLFIGNSYTAGNDLAGLVVEMFEASDSTPALTTEVIAIGGQTMGGHLATPSTVMAIEQGTWDYVVLQGQSVEPLVPDSDFSVSAIELATIVGDNGATPVLFETWARQAGHELYQQPWYGENPAQAQAGLRVAYQDVADATGGIMAPVGDAWEIIWTDAPMVPLYAGDGSHAQLPGTYLAACVFFESLSGESPVGNTGIPDGVDQATAMVLQQAADEVVN